MVVMNVTVSGARPRPAAFGEWHHRGLVLPMVLAVVLLLGLLSASFAFKVNAQRSAMKANLNRVQLRQCAEAGVHHALLILRETRQDPTVWYDNEDEFHNRVVWSTAGDWADLDVPDSIDPDSATFRYTLVADDPQDDTLRVRYGVTDESSKLNLNRAPRRQLRKLLEQVLPEDAPTGALIDALIDWRDRDSEPGLEGAEDDYYLLLETPYTIKNGDFDTVEELLLVKGFSATYLFGEDVNRNGLLDPNEDDGDRTFPPDNEDGQLSRGLHPYLTVWSRDIDRSNANVQRVSLNGDVQALRDEFGDELDESTYQYISEAKAAGVSFSSPMELYGHSFGGDQAPLGDGGGPAGGAGGDGRMLGDPQGGDNGASGGDSRTPSPGGGDEMAEEREGGGRLPQQSVPTAESPVSVEEVSMLCDRTTARGAQAAGPIEGLININTAPRVVLNCLTNDVFTAEHVDAIVAARPGLDGIQMATPAWLVTEGVIPSAVANEIYPQITARSQQFSIESIGHADHIGQMVRLQVVVELRGHVPQFLYYRDAAELGANAFPIRGQDEGDQRARNRIR